MRNRFDKSASPIFHSKLSIYTPKGISQLSNCRASLQPPQQKKRKETAAEQPQSRPPTPKTKEITLYKSPQKQEH
jgi:hypothetical protein